MTQPVAWHEFDQLVDCKCGHQKRDHGKGGCIALIAEYVLTNEQCACKKFKVKGETKS